MHQVVEIPCGPTPVETINAVVIAMKSAGYKNTPIAIGVPSAWCLCASISMDGLSRSDSKAALYRLEENLPIAAEAVVADFIFGDQSALGVCIRLDAIEPHVTALEAAGVAVQSIFPTALATVQSLVHLPARCTLLSVENDAEQVNVIEMKDAVPSAWALVPATAVDVKQQLNFLSADLNSTTDILHLGIKANLAGELSAAPVPDLDADMSMLPVRFAEQMLRGRARPWIEFRRGPMAVRDRFRQHRRWVNTSLAAAIALFVSLAGVMAFRAHRYQQMDADNTREMASAFHEHFPGWETPINIRAVVDAQLRRTRGDGNLPADQRRGSALLILHDVLVPVMTQEHLQITRMTFHETSFEIAGRVQSFEQVDGLAKLARGTGMTITPAQTHRETDGSWSFVLQGSKFPEGHSS